jgi:hypothetical protein
MNIDFGVGKSPFCWGQIHRPAIQLRFNQDSSGRERVTCWGSIMSESVTRLRIRRTGRWQTAALIAAGCNTGIGSIGSAAAR